ncbi:MAG: nitrous oxide reductase family maturation protein NosD [Bergeyella zoohelcum]|nr:nitrous oxide reductase family maturation protein NosD [Bergeyella zoohelcum]
MYQFLLLLLPLAVLAKDIRVGKDQPYKTITEAIAIAENGDRIIVGKGIYKEGNININKSLTLIGEGRPILDGEMKHEIVSFRAPRIVFKGFKLRNSGFHAVKNIGAMRLHASHNSIIENNIFENNYYGIFIQSSHQCLIQNNTFTSNRGSSEESIGNAIHGYSSKELWIKNNRMSGHKDGIYLEKISKSYIYHNYSKKNRRYGLHFMLSNQNVFIANVFDNNAAGVAVMYSEKVDMVHNKFINNWGDSIYGLLLKDISHSKIKNNYFHSNTTAVYADGATEIGFYNNEFTDNGWGLKINANCRENTLNHNNFINNTFDVSTNGTLVMNHFKQNYWDKYEGYDLDKNQIGDVPFHPLSLYSVLVQQNESVMLLFKTFLIDLLDRTEKIIPSLTPENFVDNEPKMKPNPTFNQQLK